MYIISYHVSNRQTYCNTNLVLLRLGLSEVHKTFITDRGRPKFVHGLALNLT
jgi:hypothetical protein